MNAVELRGARTTTGVYVLHLRCTALREIVVGRFAGGRPIAFPAGSYVYVGSAMGCNATSLAGRLLRHATRCPPVPPHAMRAELHRALLDAGLNAPLPQSKRKHWHVDYILDDSEIDLAHVWAMRSSAALERELAGWLATQTDLQPLVAGLGAGDHRGHTHLLHMRTPTIWADLVDRMDTAWAAG